MTSFTKTLLVVVILAALTVGGCRDRLSEETDPRKAVEPTPAESAEVEDLPDYAACIQEGLQKLKDARIPTTFEELALPDIADEENAAFLYREAFRLVDVLSDRYQYEWGYFSLDGKATWRDVPEEEKRETMGRLLRDPEYLKMCELLDEAAHMKCRFLTDEDFREALDTLSRYSLVHLSELRKCTYLLVAKAEQELESEDIDDALQTILTIFRIGKSLSDEPLIMSQLARDALEGIALYNLQDVSNQRTGNLEICRQFIDEMRDERNRDRTHDALIGELVICGVPWFHQVREAGKEAFEERIRAALEFWKPSEKEEEGGDLLQIEGLSEEDIEVSSWMAESLTKTLESLGKKGWERFLHDEECAYINAISEAITLTAQPYWQTRADVDRLAAEAEALPDGTGFALQTSATVLARAYCSEARLDARLGAGELALALRIYKEKTGWYPIQLSQLVPDTLPELPKDPFTGENFKYKARGDSFIIYSLGDNLKDDDGVSHEEKRWRGDYDIVWRLSK